MYVVQFSVANFKDSRFKFVNFCKSNFALEYVFEFLPGYWLNNLATLHMMYFILQICVEAWIVSMVLIVNKDSVFVLQIVPRVKKRFVQPTWPL